MVIYEVNLAIQADIFEEYYQWLLLHIKEMLKHTGFKKVELGQIQDETENNLKHIRISYLIESEEDLENYFSHHALQSRLEGIEKFGERFAATRRIIKNLIQLP